MITLSPIVEQLKEGGFANVEGVLEFAGLTAAPRAPLSLFVVPDGERAQPNRMSGVVDQKVSHAVAIVIMLRSGARQPGAVSDELAETVTRLCKIMLGWKHPEAGGRWEYGGGNLMSVEPGVVVWSIGFTAPYHLRQT